MHHASTSLGRAQHSPSHYPPHYSPHQSLANSSSGLHYSQSQHGFQPPPITPIPSTQSQQAIPSSGQHGYGAANYQQQQQQQNQNQSTASDIEHKTQEGIDKAKDAGNSLKNLFKKHH
jgi:hypothetical protein